MFLLPNGSGTISYIEEQGQPSPTGVFNSKGAVYSSQYQNIVPTDKPYTWMTSDFSLQRDNAIYGNNLKVQPRSYYVLMIIKA